MENTVGISIVICCYNSEARIKKVLEHLSKQKYRNIIEWEVLVIDNASKDNTAKVAIDFWNRPNVPLKVIYEPEPGLSNARSTGLREAKYPIVSMVDDDNWVDEYWVQNVSDIMSQNSSIGILGGIGVAFTEIEKPKWFDSMQRVFAVGIQSQHSGQVYRPLYGAGLNLRKAAWDHLHHNGFEFILSDRKGKSLSSGGDSELCLALMLAGYTLHYDERLTFIHFMPQNRLNWEYLLKLMESFGRTWPVLDLYKSFLDENKYRRWRAQNRWIRTIILLINYLKSWPGYFKFFMKKEPGNRKQTRFIYTKYAFIEMIRIFGEYPGIVRKIKNGKWRSSNGQNSI